MVNPDQGDMAKGGFCRSHDTIPEGESCSNIEDGSGSTLDVEGNGQNFCESGLTCQQTSTLIKTNEMGPEYLWKCD